MRPLLLAFLTLHLAACSNGSSEGENLPSAPGGAGATSDPTDRDVALGQPAVAAPDAALQGPSAEVLALFQRPAVLGASVSDGFGLESTELGVPATLSDYLDTALTLEHGPIGAHADNLTFSNPMGYLESQLKSALIGGASVVIAPDLLFWMLYGERPSEQARLERLDAGLARIAALEIPTVLGNLPDIEDPIPLLITASMIPDPETIATANARLLVWADEREHVHLVDVEGWFAALLTGDPVEVRGEIIDESLGDLVQSDGLHATSLGTAALTLACLAVLEETYGLDSGIEWDLLMVESLTRERLTSK